MSLHTYVQTLFPVKIHRSRFFFRVNPHPRLNISQKKSHPSLQGNERKKMYIFTCKKVKSCQ
jgi:hypothetical protein